MEELMRWSMGNPGALTFLMEVYASPDTNFGQAAQIDSKLRRCTSIRGTNLYVLWSDLCGRDISKVVTLCSKCPDDVLEDACNRQDYSGQKLVAKYFE